MDFSSQPDAVGANALTYTEREMPVGVPDTPLVALLPVDRSYGSELPSHITANEIEWHLDRVALAITESSHGQAYLPLYRWLEKELEARRRLQMTMSAIFERVKRLKGRKGAPS